VELQNFYSIIYRETEKTVLALCLENGITSEGENKTEAYNSLKDAIESFEIAIKEEPGIYNASIPINELHEFMTFDGKLENNYELTPMYV
jgi:hypothetical protein